MTDLKRCGLWFGTEQHMQWLPTPLRGADSSPQGWGEEGTLANGGGYAFGSFGSHKRYQYEWKSSSAREVAQTMKSYADGSYGRGLLYFISPLSFDTNILPARVADPSMASGYEGGSLCYGIEPTVTPSSVGENLYPAYETSYDLTNYHVGFKKEYGAVFVPIPEGYTLLLGASYTSTGGGGVFASPQATAGVVQSPVRLTELGAAGNVVEDKFSGVSGVWLWVGKDSAGPSSVTLRGMTGRLIESSKVIATSDTITNLAPTIEGSGEFVNTPEGPRETVKNYVGANANLFLSSLDGSPAIEVVKAGPGEGSLFSLPNALPGGASEGITARGKLYVPEDTPSVAGEVRNALYYSGDGTFDSRLAQGTYPLGGSASSNMGLVAWFGSNEDGINCKWSKPLVVMGEPYNGPFFDTKTTSFSYGGVTYRTRDLGDGVAEAYPYSPAEENIKKGPWIGGQGHSGARFNGKPTYIEYTGVGGGQVGFAASFIETGSWSQG